MLKWILGLAGNDNVVLARLLLLLLSCRTDSSYARWEEALKAWNDVRSLSKDLARQVGNCTLHPAHKPYTGRPGPAGWRLLHRELQTNARNATAMLPLASSAARHRSPIPTPNCSDLVLVAAVPFHQCTLLAVPLSAYLPVCCSCLLLYAACRAATG